MVTRRTLLRSLAVAPLWPSLALGADVPSLPADLAADKLTWPAATPEQMAFMRQVYTAHMAKAAKRGRFVGDLPRAQLGVIEKDALLVTPAAKACTALLAAARAELARQTLAKDEAALRVEQIGVLSAYRPASRQFTLWNEAFPSYFAETEAARLKLPGGPLGSEAVKYTMLFVRRHMAAPGTSLHNTGKAVDFQTTQNGLWLIADRTQRAAWRQSWFFAWLGRSAPGFGFHENRSIDEPWHWEWR